MTIFVGDDWSEDHHDVHLMDADGDRLASRRLPEGLVGIRGFHELVAAHAEEPGQVVIGIETDRGLWVEALSAAGYEVYAINPLAAARYRDRHHVSGAKSDAGDAKLLADLVRTDRHNHRPIAGDSAGGNLAAVTAILCRDRAVTQPAAQLLLYPAIDPSFETDSYHRYRTGYFNTRAAMQWYWRQYLGDEKVFDPQYLVAPARAESHAGLPPAVIATAGLDPLHSEGCDYAHRLRGAGVRVVHRDFPGLFHGFMTIQSFAPAARARDLVCADLRQIVSEPQTNAKRK